MLRVSERGITKSESKGEWEAAGVSQPSVPTVEIHDTPRLISISEYIILPHDLELHVFECWDFFPCGNIKIQF